jgi:hypothetical protein
MARVAPTPYRQLSRTPARRTVKSIEGAALRRLAATVASRIRRCGRLLVVRGIGEE